MIAKIKSKFIINVYTHGIMGLISVNKVSETTFKLNFLMDSFLLYQITVSNYLPNQK